ncbi:uncharacterized protein RAG0_16143 [Rhynchosporium agropyri]|uniref:Uncharacterized protein n=1 Tax=Rhynchosporium agropyri TaxID=914238 RepID=A0A1E1LP30_9HELO|nr:uncharacterized protein RAG0_16143 [Rhynchosporium agropyri]
MSASDYTNIHTYNHLLRPQYYTTNFIHKPSKCALSPSSTLGLVPLPLYKQPNMVTMANAVESPTVYLGSAKDGLVVILAHQAPAAAVLVLAIGVTRVC